MDKVFKTAVILTAQDEMSRKVAEAVDKVDKRMGRMAWSAQKAGKTAIQTGLGMAAPLILATREAVKFESAMADVGKVMDFSTGDETFKRLSADAQELSEYLGESSVGVSQMFANLAQGGIAEQNLARVSKIAGEMGVAFDISADVAGKSFINIQNALGTTIEQTEGVTDSINHISNQLAAAAPDLVRFLTAGAAGAARAAEVSGEQAAAFGSAWISMGKSAEESSTIFERFIKNINSNEDIYKIFDRAGRGAGGLVAVLEEGLRFTGRGRAEFFQQFGQYGQQIQLVAENMTQKGGLTDALALVAEQSDYAGSRSAEFLNRMDTSEGRMNRATAAFKNFGISIGMTLIPLLTEFLGAINPILQTMRDWMAANPELAATLTKVVAITAAGLIVFGGAAFAFGKVVDAARLLLPVIKKLTVLMRGLSLVVMANPWLLLAAAAVAAVYLIYRYWEPIKAFFSRLWGFITAGFEHGFVYGILNVLKMFNPTYWIARAFNEVSKYLFGIDLFEAGANVVKTIWRGIKSFVNKPIEAIAGMAQKMRNYLPFSPAKEGPLRDLHRVKIVETIADTINPRPVQQAMAGAMSPVAGGFSTGGGGGAIDINYSPTIYMGAGGNREQLEALLADHGRDLLRRVREAMEDYNRTKF